MSPVRLLSTGVTSLVVFIVPACVKDHEVEDDVPAQPGITQPDGSGTGKLSAANACSRLTDVRRVTATELGCDDLGDECPNYLFVGGSIRCDEYTEGSVTACEATIRGYRECSHFSTKACIVTPVSSSCHEPAAPEAGPHGKDAGKIPKDASRSKDAEPARG